MAVIVLCSVLGCHPSVVSSFLWWLSAVIVPCSVLAVIGGRHAPRDRAKERESDQPSETFAHFAINHFMGLRFGYS